MTREQEDRIIAQAQDILSKRIGVAHDIKIDLQRLVQYSAFYMGALASAQRFYEIFFSSGKKPKNDDWVYIRAELRLCRQSKRMMQLWLDGTPIRYRNHKKDKKGRLVEVDAYFCETRIIQTEIT